MGYNVFIDLGLNLCYLFIEQLQNFRTIYAGYELVLGMKLDISWI